MLINNELEKFAGMDCMHILQYIALFRYGSLGKLLAPFFFYGLD
jgi:hypothetical protein